MFKRTFILLCAAILCFSWIPQVSLAETGNTIDHRLSVEYDKFTNGRLLVPIRAVTEFVGGTVTWDNMNNRIEISKNERHIHLQINSKLAQVDGKPLSLDAAPAVERGVTYVPLRFVGEALGLTVEWVPRQREALLNDSESHTRLVISIKPPLPLDQAVALMNKVSIAYDLSAIKQKQQYLKPYFTDRMIKEIISSGGLRQFPDQKKQPNYSFSSDQNPIYQYANDNMMFINRSILIDNGGALAYESGTLVRTSEGWRIDVVRWLIDYPH